jgi:hypothetical protein
VSSIAAERWGLRWYASATRHTFSGVCAVRGRPGCFLLTIDAVILNCVTQFNIVRCVGTFPFLPMPKCSRKTRRVTVAESLFIIKTFPQQTLDDLPMITAWWLKASNRSTQRCVFHCVIYKDVGMALNLNRLIVSAPPCTKNGSVWEWECSRRRVLLADWGEDYSTIAQLSTNVLLEWVTPPVGYKQSVVRTGYSFAVATPQIRHWPCADNRALI